jgi:hypothetical protein
VRSAEDLVTPTVASLRHGLGSHGWAAVALYRELTAVDAFLDAVFVNQSFGKMLGFPADLFTEVTNGGAGWCRPPLSCGCHRGSCGCVTTTGIGGDSGSRTVSTSRTIPSQSRLSRSLRHRFRLGPLPVQKRTMSGCRRALRPLRSAMLLEAARRAVLQAKGVAC